MNQKFDIPRDTAQRTVYVRPVDVGDLPDDLRDRTGGRGTVYALHDEAGGRLALVRDRRLAFVVARQHDLDPVSVH